MKDKIINLFLFLVVAAIFVWLGMTFYKAYEKKPEVLQGQIEAQTYSVSSKIAGRVDKVYVKKGQKIKKGDIIFRINSPELQAKINQAIAEKDAASAMLKKAKNGARKQKIAAAYDNYEKAKVASELMQKTYKRVKKLYQSGVISKQKVDEAYTKYKASVFTSKAALQMYEMAKEGSREETKDLALQKQKAAKSKVEEVESYAKDLSIKSFYDGEVSNILMQSGELAPTGFPVVQITDMNDAWVVLHVREDKLKDFKVGSEFTGFIPALDKKVTFKVSFVSVLGDFATWRATNIKDEYDMRVFEVEARPKQKIKDLRVGMSVVVR